MAMQPRSHFSLFTPELWEDSIMSTLQTVTLSLADVTQK